MRLSFDRRLAFSIIPVVVATIGLLAFLSYRKAAESLMTERASAMDQHVQRTVRELDQWIGDRIHIAEFLAANQRFQTACAAGDREPAQQALIAYNREWKLYENIFLADPSGKIFLDSVGGKSVGVDIGQHPDYRINVEKARANEPWVGDAKKSPATGHPVSLVTAPILKDGQLIGIMGTPVELSAFAEGFANGVRIGRSGFLYVLDSAGVPLVHPDRSLILDSGFGMRPFVRGMFGRGSGQTEYEEGGKRYFGSFGLFAGKGWLVVAAAPKEELNEIVRPIRTLSLALALIGSAVTGLITWLVSRRALRLLGSAISELTATGEEVASAAARISASSQELAQGASGQAASLEETSATAEEINSMACRHADSSRAAVEAVTGSEGKMSEANRSLDEMVGAMGAIKASSDRIAKIIKVIDEIAFQTNILALNAAVEAARAGEAGLGFAVVADEVRNLAQRCASAAKDTASLIEESIANSAIGKTRVDGVASVIRSTTVDAARVKTLVEEMKLGSEEQARGLEQISKTIAQMQAVTQGAAATAEESASTGQQLTAQAQALQQLVQRLNALVGAGISPNRD